MTTPSATVGNGDENESSESGEANKEKESDFVAIWGEFYDKAVASVTSYKDEPEDIQRQQALKLLNNFHRSIFALDQEKKSAAVNYGGGGLELILSIVSTINARNDEQVIIAVLKSLRSCVVNNPIGRSRCRRAGVFDYVGDIMEACLEGEKKKVTEEVLTTFAAMCLGDDLNALQGALLYKETIQKLSSAYPSPMVKPSNTTNMCTYLLTLFSKTLADLPNSTPLPHSASLTFFSTFTRVEKISAQAGEALLAQQFGFAEGQYTNAIKAILAVTCREDKRLSKFVAPTVSRLYSDRAICRLETGYAESALNDAEEALLWCDESEQREVKERVLKVLGEGATVAATTT